MRREFLHSDGQMEKLNRANTFFFFTVAPCILINQVFILSNRCTVKYFKKILKFTLKLTLKVLLHVSV